MLQPINLVGFVMFGAGLSAAAVWDIRHRRVPNGLNLCLLVGGLVLALVHGALVQGLLGFLVGLALLLVPFARRWVGAGDVKLLAAVGAWLGPERTLHCGLVAAVFGGVLAVGFLVKLGPEYRRAVAANLKLAIYVRGVPTVEDRPESHCPPYAVAIALGALVVAALTGGPGVG